MELLGCHCNAGGSIGTASLVRRLRGQNDNGMPENDEQPRRQAGSGRRLAKFQGTSQGLAGRE